MKITITGSLGRVSNHLALNLVKSGHTVTIISSTLANQTKITGIGAIPAIGSVDDPQFLEEAFKGADAVYTMIPSMSLTDQKLDALAFSRSICDSYIQAIEKSGVKRIVHLSSIGAHLGGGNGLLRLHHIAEVLLNKLSSDISLTIMRPAGFYDNLYAYKDLIKGKGFLGKLLAIQFYGLSGLLGKKKGVIISNYGEKDIIPWVSPVDIASAVAEELVNLNSETRVRYVASEVISCNEVATALGEAIGKPYLKWGIISDKQLLRGLVSSGMSKEVAEGMVEMNASQRGGKLFEDYYSNQPELGKVKIKEFAKAFAETYFND